MGKYIVVDSEKLKNLLIKLEIRSNIEDLTKHSDYYETEKWAESEVQKLDTNISIKRSLFPTNICQIIGYNPVNEPWCHCNSSCAFCYTNKLNCKVNERRRS